MQRYNDLNTSTIALVGFVGALLTFVLIVALQVLYFAVSREQTQRKVIGASTAGSDTLLAEQEVRLTRYGWIDRQEKQVVVPIERAMDLVVDELSAGQREERNDDS
jgi:hypothetical protein